MKILLICALEEELRGIYQDNPMVSTGIVKTSPSIDDNEFFIYRVGVGKMKAFRKTLDILERFTPDMVVSTGAAGSLSERFGIGDIVTGKEVIDEKSGDVFPCDLDMTQRVFGRHLNRVGSNMCTIVTVERPVVYSSMKDSLFKRFGESCVEMEASGVASACRAIKIPFTSIKVVTDHANLDPKIPEEYLFSPETSKLEKLWLLLTRDPATLIRYLRLKRNFRKGMRSLGLFYDSLYRR